MGRRGVGQAAQLPPGDIDALIALVQKLGGTVIDDCSGVASAHTVPVLVLTTLPNAGTAELTTPRASPAADRAMLKRQGDFWTLAYGGSVMHLRHRKGLEQLVALLANPGHEIDALALASGSVGVRSEAPALPDAACDPCVSIGPVLDRHAKASYRARAEALHRDIARARSAGDAGRAGRAEVELAFLEGELRRGSALGGRDRPVASNRERARVNVTRAVRAAITAIAAAQPRLGEHLDESVQTGVRCSYRPCATDSVVWELRRPPRPWPDLLTG